MKILLVCPKYEFQGYTPTGLASIGAVAEKLGHQVTILDLNVERKPLKGYDLVGITGLSLWRKSIIETSRMFHNTPVIVGGAWATLQPKYAVSLPSIDFACMREGEATFKEFLEKYPAVEDVEGIVSTYKSNDHRPYIQDLDALPLPAWHLLNLTKYRRISITTSRGCPYRCIFCGVHQFLGRQWRYRSVESVVEEIELLVRYKVERITFGDSNLTFIPDRFQAICEEIINRKIKCEFDVIQGVRADRLTPQLLTTMKKAGFTEVIIAPESGSQRVVDDVVHKNLDLSTVEPVVKHCVEIGLNIGSFFVIGFPWETMEEINETIAFADKLRSMGSSCYVGNAIPILGTELYHRAKEEGFLRFDDPNLEELIYYSGLPREIHCLTSPYWKPEQIIALCKREQEKNKGVEKQQIRKTYFSYSISKIAKKFVRHPIRTIRRALRVI